MTSEGSSANGTRRSAVPPIWFSIGGPPRREPPVVPGYRLALWEQVPLGRLSAFGCLSVPLWFVFFSLAVAVLGGPSEFAVVFTFRAILVGLLLMLVVVPLLHEAVHGVVSLLIGARPSFGVGAGFAYTTFREPVGRLAYAAIALAPLVVISIVGIAAMVWWPKGAEATLVVLIVNAAGAVGDLWMVWRLRAVPPNARLYDLADGFAALVPEEASTQMQAEA
ncbi:DUF3267 domain-containing protein [Sphaerobacter sp.]|uniref:DUF3267 domain-containing protein n=1 Tax=Sphaerobacter sp. TaxID=2099654 RepID=UPI001D4CDBB0|nr:DUF3267 domain-containing protein [Sphaerobacter sp.]MBX5445165.1 DUF3267 domain-containing protein [Sphaerobacter sp.]